jgi:hypothetical protein
VLRILSPCVELPRSGDRQCKIAIILASIGKKEVNVYISVVNMHLCVVNKPLALTGEIFLAAAILGRHIKKFDGGLNQTLSGASPQLTAWNARKHCICCGQLWTRSGENYEYVMWNVF